ncbi:MAG: lipopolysaccharide heptosyltransferase II [Legionellales bacterium]|nr:lipopolysaccharide heptosyltransferase II [Legionellales bacterium]
MKGCKTLVIGPAWLGDVVMAQALVKTLVAQQCVVDMSSPSWCHPVLARMPEVSQAIALDLPRNQCAWRQWRAYGKQFKQHGYDQVFVLPNTWKSAFIAWSAGIKRRVGWVGEQRWGLLNDIRRLDIQKWPNMVQRYVALAHDAHWCGEDYPRPRLQVDQAAIPTILARHQRTLPQQPVVILCPGAAFGVTRRWPVNYFATIANRFIEQGKQVWLYGSHKEQPLAEQIQVLTQGRCVDFTGLALDQAIDLMSLADLVVSNDSGLMHVAAALDIPTIVIYGSTAPDYTFPLTDRAHMLIERLACQPCFRKTCRYGHLACLNRITPDQVLRVADESFIG